MSQWSLVIYGLAAVWGVQSLLGLMLSYRRQKLVELQQAELVRRQSEDRQQQEIVERLPGLKAKPEPQPAKAA
ncbi:MAG TPA: hypothetical protein VM165_11225 [Planctomycetaceae bacterium]|nr:hypothetical protein [Planctomycetaceae bacterium]